MNSRDNKVQNTISRSASIQKVDGFQSTYEKQSVDQSHYERQLFVNARSIEVKAPVSVEHSHTYKYFCDGEYDIMVGFEQGATRLYQESLQKLLQEYKLEVNFGFKYAL